MASSVKMLGVEEIPLEHTARRFHATGRLALTDTKEADREALREWIRNGIANHPTVKSATGLASHLGIATTTLTKFLNDPKYKHTPSTPTIALLEREFGSRAPRVAGFEEVQAPSRRSEGAEVDLAKMPKPLQAAIKALAAERRGLEVWRIETDLLDAYGYHPGDLVMIDPNEYVKAGDAVLAIAEGRRPLFRILQKPYLVAKSEPPALVDDRTVIVKGKIVGRLTWPLS
jgi:hypothetical protein